MKTDAQKTILHDVVVSIEEQKNAQKQPDSIDGIYIFISFDLVNSTLFKNRHMNLWPRFISAFYESVVQGFGIGQYKLREIPSEGYEELIQKTNGFQLWKLVGDEVLLYHKVVSKEELYDTIVLVEKMRKRLIRDTIQKCLGEKTEENKEAYEEKERLFRSYFAIKTAVWVGNCVEKVENVNGVKQNLVFDQMVLDNEASIISRKLDFLGPDIDEGFRICGYAEKNKMIVTPKLVYLLLKAFKDELDKQTVLVTNFKIVNYVSMKGVWEQRLYPIIMFCQNDATSSLTSIENWKRQFDYDAFETSKLYENIDKFGEQFLTDSRFSITNLSQIYKDNVREDEMEQLQKSLQKQEEQLKLLDVTNSSFVGNFEFHVACLCYNPKKRKYWVIKHPTHGWSFGCVRVQKNEDYLSFVAGRYKAKYDLDISLSDENQLISFYEANREPIRKGSILGVVLLVTEVSGEGKKDGEECGWYTYEEIMNEEMLAGKRSKGFDEIINKARKLIAV